MKKKIIALAYLFMLINCASENQSPKLKEKPIQIIKEVKEKKEHCYDIECFKTRMILNGVATQEQIDQFFSKVSYNDNIIQIMNRPGTSRPWYEFRLNNVSKLVIKKGIDFFDKNYLILKAVSESTGVAPEYIVAILGIETRYGAIQGNESIPDVLYTLAFYYPRRVELFQKELEEFFLMAKETNRDPFSFTGSFAGAMGYPQFLPSSYRKWAVSYSGFKFADIWNKEEDAIASIGNYLQQHGWKSGEPVIVPVSLELTDELQGIINEKTELKHSVGELKSKGVIFSQDLDNNMKAVLFRLEVSPAHYEYFVGLNNFYTIWKYNHSRLYVMAVEEIANAIRRGISQ